MSQPVQQQAFQHTRHHYSATLYQTIFTDVNHCPVISSSIQCIMSTNQWTAEHNGSAYSLLITVVTVVCTICYLCGHVLHPVLTWLSISTVVRGGVGRGELKVVQLEGGGVQMALCEGGGEG